MVQFGLQVGEFVLERKFLSQELGRIAGDRVKGVKLGLVMMIRVSQVFFSRPNRLRQPYCFSP